MGYNSYIKTITIDRSTGEKISETYKKAEVSYNPINGIVKILAEEFLKSKRNI